MKFKFDKILVAILTFSLFALQSRAENISSKSFEEINTNLNSQAEESIYRKYKLIFIIDESGSMFPRCEDVVGGYNSMIEQQKIQEKERREKLKNENKESKEETFVKVYKFNNQVTEFSEVSLLNAPKMSLNKMNSGLAAIYHKSFPLSSVKPSEEKIRQQEYTYSPNGITALYDAVGKALSNILVRQNSDIANPKKDANGNTIKHDYMVTIITDGLENASREYNKESVKKLTEECEKNGATIIFQGANIDSASEGAKIGIKLQNSVNFNMSPDGINKMWSDTNARCMSFRNEELIKTPNDIGSKSKN
jgi:hypothetical protein